MSEFLLKDTLPIPASQIQHLVLMPSEALYVEFEIVLTSNYIAIHPIPLSAKARNINIHQSEHDGISNLSAANIQFTAHPCDMKSYCSKFTCQCK